MIVGIIGNFAIESEIAQAIVTKSQMAIGFFNIHLGGKRYGVTSPEASLLACSYNEVNNRIARRGLHQSPIQANFNGLEMATAYLRAEYHETTDEVKFFGMSTERFMASLRSNSIIWAPDGDEAFDDGSHVLQFDVGSEVRILAFKNINKIENLQQTFAERWLDADTFYGILDQWRMSFEKEWMEKLPAEI